MKLTISKGEIVNNPHLFSILFITMLITLLYLPWPWRPWIIESGIWRWLPQLSYFFKLALFECMHRVFGFLFIIPIIYAILTLRPLNFMYTILLVIIGICPIVMGLFHNVNIYLNNSFLLLLPIIIAIAINLELELRRKGKQYLIDQERERRMYISRLLEIQEIERRKVAQELHDETVQTFLAIASYAKASESSGNIKIAQNSKLIRESAIKSAEELREMILKLRPRILDSLGLVPALRWLINSVKGEEHISFEISIDGEECGLDSTIEIAIFRIVQEALNNIKRHSNASEAKINLKYLNDSLNISISDNGHGFPQSSTVKDLANQGKIGLIGMRERVHFLNGKFGMFSKMGEGTVISIKIPLAQPSITTQLFPSEADSVIQIENKAI